MRAFPSLAAAMLCVASCAPVHSPAPPLASCAAEPPASASRLAPAALPHLAGRWALVLVNTGSPVGARVGTAMIVLEEPDSAYRWGARALGSRTGERPLVGWAETGWGAPATARDSAAPGIVGFRTAAGVELVVGYRDGMLDGGGTHLLPGAVGGVDGVEAFWGTWSDDYGIVAICCDRRGRTYPNPSGHFCARRVPAAGRADEQRRPAGV